MKKLILFAFLFSGLNLLAQPTLTSSNFTPIVGDSQLYYVADTNSTIDPTIGANVIFDYTNLRGYGATQTEYFVNPTTTTYASDFPTASYADTTQGFPINKKYTEVVATDSLSNVGFVANITTFGTVVAKYNQDPEILMKFPFNYGNNYTDNYSGVFTVQGQNTNGNGVDTVNADAWGKLMLPNGVTIDSVLRVKTAEHLVTDTIVIPFPPITVLPVNVDANYINYYKPSINKFPLLSIVDVSYNQNNSTISSSRIVISQYSMPGVGINELSNEIGLKLFPNPAENGITNLFFNLKQSKTVQINILNQLGQNVKVIFNGKLNNGDNKIDINTSNLKHGVYFVQITIDGQLITKKLLI